MIIKPIRSRGKHAPSCSFLQPHPDRIRDRAPNPPNHHLLLEAAQSGPAPSEEKPICYPRRSAGWHSARGLRSGYLSDLVLIRVLPSTAAKTVTDAHRHDFLEIMPIRVIPCADLIQKDHGVPLVAAPSPARGQKQRSLGVLNHYFHLTCTFPEICINSEAARLKISNNLSPKIFPKQQKSQICYWTAAGL